MMLVPDEMGSEIYSATSLPDMTKGKYLAFAHGFNIHFKQIVPDAGVNVFMVAPKGPGHLVRSEYEDGRGVPCLLALHQDPSGDTREVGLAYAKAIGGTRAAVLETTFKEETETDLFGEQSVLCGGIYGADPRRLRDLGRSGLQPGDGLLRVSPRSEADRRSDLRGRHRQHALLDQSNTAEYGDMTRGKRVIGAEARKAMKEILGEIQSGKFAEEWMTEHRVGSPHFGELRKEAEKHPIEEVGNKLRSMMPWLSSGRLVDRSRN